MVHIGAVYVTSKLSSESKTSLLNLSAPSVVTPSTDEEEIVALAKDALHYLKTKSQPDSRFCQKITEASEEVLKVMLIWACNSFDDDRIYHLQSRINHNCRPNAVIKNLTDSSSSSQSVQAAAHIASGDEITISYLGMLLYADNSVRQEELRLTRFFSCACTRCIEGPDIAASIPCVKCHPRTARGKRLDEDTQYDDELTVRYMYPTSLTKPMMWTTAGACQTIYVDQANVASGNPTAALLSTVRSISRSMAGYLRSRRPTKLLPSTDRRIRSGNDDDENDEEDTAILEENLILCGSVLGARHWTTNLLLLLKLDELLHAYHVRLLQPEFEGDLESDMAMIAQCIDMLERIVRFVDGLSLPLHRGHLLSTAIIGVARALVSLGDSKSRAYAADWLAQLDGYVEHFAPEGIRRVVASLKRPNNKNVKNLRQEERVGKKLKTIKSKFYS